MQLTRHGLYLMGIRGPESHHWEKESEVAHPLVAGQYHYAGVSVRKTHLDLNSLNQLKVKQ